MKKILKYLNYHKNKFAFLRSHTKSKKFIFIYIYTEIYKFFLKKIRSKIILNIIEDLKNNYKLEKSFFGYERNIYWWKNLFLFRDDHDTNIDFSINFVNIAYMIAQSLGLDREEW